MRWQQSPAWVMPHQARPGPAKPSQDWSAVVEVMAIDHAGHWRAGGGQPATVALAFGLPRPLGGRWADVGRKLGDSPHQMTSPNDRAHQRRLALLIHAMNRENVLGEIEFDIHNGRGCSPCIGVR